MQSLREVRFLKAMYLIGAVADALSVLPMLMPDLGKEMLGLEELEATVEFKYAMGLGASLMLGWTVLLVWGYRKPVERHAVLGMTAVPVLAGLILATVYVSSAGAVSASRAAPMLIWQVILLGLFAFAYRKGRALHQSATAP